MHLVSSITPLLFAAAVIAKPVDVEKRGVTTSTSTTCSYTSIKPSPSPLICGKEGMITRVDSTILSWESGSEANKCLTYCKATSACVSYSWNSTSDVCMYYNAAIKASNFTMIGKSNTYFWNKRCFGQGCSTTKVTLTSTTSSSSSSKTSTVKTTPTTTSKATTTAKTTTTKKTTSTTTTKKTTTTTTPKSTCTSTPDLSLATCNAITVSLGPLTTATFTLYYTGTSTVEAPLSGSKTVLIPNANSICDAAKACANQASLLGIAGLYSSFDLHYLKEKCEFECVLNVMPNLDGGAFNVSAPDVGASVGFSVGLSVGL